MSNMNNEKSKRITESNERAGYRKIRSGLVYDDCDKQQLADEITRLKNLAEQIGVIPFLSYDDMEEEVKYLRECIERKAERTMEAFQEYTQNVSENTSDPTEAKIRMAASLKRKKLTTDAFIKSVDGEVVKEEEKKTAVEICEELLKRVRFVECEGRLFYYKDNCYRYADRENEIEKLVADLFYEDVARYGNAKITKSVRDMVIITPQIPQVQNLNRYISIQEGLYDFATGELLSHTPDLFCNYSLNISWEKARKHGCNRYLQYLNDLYAGYVGCSDLVKRDLQILGWLLSPDTFSRKFLQIRGEAGTGKSRRVEFYKRFFRPEDTMTATMENMDGRFGMSLFYGKRFVDCGDLEDDIMSPAIVAKVKRITGGDDITVEPKGKQPFMYRPHSKIVFCSNFPLKLKRKDDALAERLLVLPMNKKLAMEDRITDFFAQFEDERDALALLALREYNSVKSNHYQFAGEEYVRMVLNNSSLIELSEQNGERTAYEAFMEDCIDISEAIDDYIISSELGEAFLTYAIENGYQEYGNKKTAAISRAVKEIANSRFVQTKKINLGKPVNVITGLRFKENKIESTASVEA